MKANFNRLQNSAVVGMVTNLRKATISFITSLRPSVRPSAWNNSAPTGRIFTKIDE
jgi:hypothetical protein